MPYETDDYSVDQTLLTLSDFGIKTASASTFEVENTSGGGPATTIVVNSTNTTFTSSLDFDCDEIDAENDFDVANIPGADLALGVGVLKYTPASNLVQYSTSDPASGITFTLTVTHTGYSGINAVYVKEDSSTGTDLISPNPTLFNPRIEDGSTSIGTITSSSTTIAIAANANSGDSAYSWSGSSTISAAGFSSFYRVFSGFTNGSYTLTVTTTDDD
tara:strand:- start:489 stop:1139 length:651 start_codon:yes stop_codon:yes gene_type:complete